MKDIPLAQRLIVALDYAPSEEAMEKRMGRHEAYAKFKDMVRLLGPLGVFIKANSLLRAIGLDLIKFVHDQGCLFFADWKLFDIGGTLEIDGKFLFDEPPELLTAACAAGPAALLALSKALPKGTELLGVTALTSLTDDDTQLMFACSTKEAVLRFAGVAKMAHMGGLISAATEVEEMRQKGFGSLMTFNTPAIRFANKVVAGDDQNKKRVVTPFEAIRLGADRFVMGRPITDDPDPVAAARRALMEASAALAA